MTEITRSEDATDVRDRTIRKLYKRIVLFAFICFIVNYLDRVNIGFAALHMNQDLGLTPYLFGIGAGIFFLGYMAFEIPSNMMLHKFGPRVWIARIMVSWGLISCGMAFISGPTSFFVMRFLLGVAEAGFAPGILLYLTYWFPARERGRATALFMTATVLSIVFGAPLSGWLIEYGDGMLSLKGWQFMFLVEGLPAVILGVVAFFYLVDKPENDRHWLAEDERGWLIGQLDAERRGKGLDARHDLRSALSDARTWLLTLVYLGNSTALYGVILWLPQIVKSIGGLTPVQVGFVSAIPFVFAAIGMIVIARNSDRTGERKYHTAITGLGGGVFLGASAMVADPYLALALLCVCAFFLWAYLGVFWTLPTQYLSGAAAAAGLAAINGFAQIGGFVGPYLVGWIKSGTDSFALALLALAVFPLVSFVTTMTLRVKRN